MPFSDKDEFFIKKTEFLRYSIFNLQFKGGIMVDFSLTNKVALITGASRGIGMLKPLNIYIFPEIMTRLV